MGTVTKIRFVSGCQTVQYLNGGLKTRLKKRFLVLNFQYLNGLPSHVTTIWIPDTHTVQYSGVQYSDRYYMSAYQMFQFPKSVHASSFNYGEKTFAQNFAARPWCFTFEDKQFILEICRKHDTGLTLLERVVLLKKNLFVQWRVALPCIWIVDGL